MSTHAFGGRTHDFGIADRLRAAREDAGMDQRAFAERTGLSRATISNYERGIHKPRRPQLVVWALATGFSLGWLETGSPSDGDPDRLPRLDSNQQPLGKRPGEDGRTRRHLGLVA